MEQPCLCLKPRLDNKIDYWWGMLLRYLSVPCCVIIIIYLLNQTASTRGLQAYISNYFFIFTHLYTIFISFLLIFLFFLFIHLFYINFFYSFLSLFLSFSYIYFPCFFIRISISLPLSLSFSPLLYFVLSLLALFIFPWKGSCCPFIWVINLNRSPRPIRV